RTVLGTVLDALLRMLHPMIPFVTETLWKVLTGGESLVIASWPTADATPADPDAARQVADAQKLITELRRFRSDQGVKPSQRVPARLGEIDEAGLGTLEEAVRSLARVTAPDDGFTATASIEVRLSGATVCVDLDTSTAVDVEAEQRRLTKDLAAARKELAGTTAKLGNESFLGKAPAEVVEKIRARRDVAEADVDRLTARLAELE